MTNNRCSRAHEVSKDLSMNIGSAMTLLIFNDEIFEDADVSGTKLSFSA